MLIKLFKIAWRDFFYDPNSKIQDDFGESEEAFIQINPPSPARKQQYL